MSGSSHGHYYEIVVLMNPHSKDLVTGIVNKFIDKRFPGSRHEKSFTKFISSREEFNNSRTLFSNLMSGNPDRYLIACPELLWGAESPIDEGYKITANELVEHRSLIQIRMLSVLPHRRLKDKVSSGFKSFVDSFPHINLMQDEGVILSALSQDYSVARFSMMKSVLVEEGGYLDYLAHELSRCKNSNNGDLQEAQILIDIVHGLVAQSFGSMPIIESGNVTKENMKPKIDEAIKAVNKLSGRGSSQIGNDLKVLLIEDNKNERAEIVKKIQDRHLFRSVDAVEGSGPEFLRQLMTKLDLNDEEFNYDLVLLDLLFSDADGQWLNLCGFDVLKMMRERHPYVTVAILSALPRNRIVSMRRKILPHEEVPYSLLLSKKDGIDPLVADLSYKLEDIVHMVGDKAAKKNHEGNVKLPSNGMFNRDEIRRGLYLRFLDPERHCEFQKMVEDAFNFVVYPTEGLEAIAGKVRDLEGIQNQASRKISSDDFWNEKLATVLKYRLCLITIEKNTSRPISEYDFHPKNHATTLCGFNMSKGRVLLNNLFPHEINYLYELEHKKYDEPLDEEQKNWLRPILEDTKVFGNIPILGNEVLNNVYNEDGDIRDAIFNDIKICWVQDFLEALNFHHNAHMNPVRSMMRVVITVTYSMFGADWNDHSNLPESINELLDKIECEFGVNPAAVN